MEAPRNRQLERFYRVTKVHLFFLIACFGIGLTLVDGQKPLNLGTAKKKDVYIAGFFPYGSHVPESHVGRGVMPSVKLAVDHINENPTILRNYRLHMWWNDTECNAAVGVKAFFDMMHNGPHKVMLFGAACTQVTDPIAKASKHWRLTQLSYADTHPMFTGNSFPNFFRVVPSENAFNAPRVALLVHFNWTRVGTIYQNEPRYALAHNRLVADLDANGMEVVETQSFATEVSSALKKLKEKDVRIILGNFDETWARQIFCEAYKFGMFGRKYQWVIMGTYANNWWMKAVTGCSTSELAEALHAAILTDLLPLTTDNRVTISGITPDEYRVEYDSRRASEYSRFHGYTYDGIWAVALAIQHVARRIKHHRRDQTIADFKYRDELWERLFLEALKNTSFEGVTGPVRFYENERKAYILLKQFQLDSEVKVGEYNAVTGILDLTRGNPLLWRGKSPPKDRTLHIIEQSTVNITIYAILTSTASVGIVMAIIFLSINIKYRNQRYIKMSSPHLNNLIIIGCILTYSSVIVLGLDSQLSSITVFPYICTARACLLMAGFSLAFGSMFSKTWRVHSIFTDVKLNKKVIKDYQLFMVVGVLLVIDLAIMLTWQIADPFYRETKQMEPYPHPSSEDIIIIPENEYCQSNRMTVYLGSIYAYKGLLMMFGAFLAWETRHVSIPALNDSKYVGMSVYNVVIMCVTGAAISFVLADKQDAMFIMLAVFIIFCSTATLCLVFVPKLIELRRNPQGAIDKRIRATLRPMSKTRRDSTMSQIEERMKDATVANQKYKKQLIEKDSELQMFLQKLGDEEDTIDTQNTLNKLNIPKQDVSIRREGPSVTTETTDISVSMCSLNSTNFPPEGDYVNVPTEHHHQSSKKKAFSSKMAAIIGDNERQPLVQSHDTETYDSVGQQANLKYKGYSVLCQDDRHREEETPSPKRSQMESVSSEQIFHARSTEPRIFSFEDAKIPEVGTTLKTEQKPRIPSSTILKNVSFGQLKDRDYLEKTALSSAQFIPRHQHSSPGVQISEASMRRRYSTKNNGAIHSHQESGELRRTSIPTDSISYINTESIPTKESLRSSAQTFDKHHSAERGYKRILSIGGSGYRCEKHGGRDRDHGMTNGLSQTPPSFKKHIVSHGSHNSSSPNVPATVNASSHSHSDKYNEMISTLIQRSVSEKSREKCPHLRLILGSSGECPYHGSHATRTLRYADSKLRQQARLEYVQSTPNVATIHNHKYTTTNPRGSCTTNLRIGDSSAVVISGISSDVVCSSNVNVSKLCSAVSDGELLDLAILPIFQKLLSERHKSVSARRSVYGTSIASCPNISIKCDIVEYL